MAIITKLCSRIFGMLHKYAQECSKICSDQCKRDCGRERDGKSEKGKRWEVSVGVREKLTEVADRRSSFKLLLLLLAYINNCQKQIGKVMRLQLMRPAEIVAVKMAQQPNGSAQHIHMYIHTHTQTQVKYEYPKLLALLWLLVFKFRVRACILA